jgi:hypothetical protein
VATLTEHVDIAWPFIPQMLVIAVVNLEAIGNVADFTLWPDAQDVTPKAKPVVGLQVDVLVPVLPGHDVSLAGVRRPITSCGFSYIKSPFSSSIPCAASLLQKGHEYSEPAHRYAGFGVTVENG